MSVGRGPARFRRASRSAEGGLGSRFSARNAGSGAAAGCATARPPHAARSGSPACQLMALAPVDQSSECRSGTCDPCNLRPYLGPDLATCDFDILTAFTPRSTASTSSASASPTPRLPGVNRHGIRTPFSGSAPAPGLQPPGAASASRRDPPALPTAHPTLRPPSPLSAPPRPLVGCASAVIISARRRWARQKWSASEPKTFCLAAVALSPTDSRRPLTVGGVASEAVMSSATLGST